MSFQRLPFFCIQCTSLAPILISRVEGQVICVRNRASAGALALASALSLKVTFVGNGEVLFFLYLHREQMYLHGNASYCVEIGWHYT